MATTPQRDAMSIFLEAIEMPSENEQTRLLDVVCSGESTLRAEVEALLREHREIGTFHETVEPLYAGPSLTPGDRVGPYKIRERIGEGGMGLVFAAEQTKPVQRMVALKVIKPGMDSQEVIARFDSERHALSVLEHPNIARILDAGITDSGHPYFAMELVRGITITEYCDELSLPPEERLRLFIEVCHAVQHAHQKGIIHRDVKPSNVLVTQIDGNPVIKVIDFGLAKATGHLELSDKTVYTQFMKFMGTPAYMSPEQAGISGVDIDTRSNI